MNLRRGRISAAGNPKRQPGESGLQNNRAEAVLRAAIEPRFLAERGTGVEFIRQILVQ